MSTTTKELTTFQSSAIAQVTTTTSIAQIAVIIGKDWQGMSYAAKPYYNAMRGMGSVKDNYGADSGKSIVRYFLSNASTWKGPVARHVKAVLNKMVK